MEMADRVYIDYLSNYKYIELIFYNMYLIVPSGLMQTLYDGFSKFLCLGHYWHKVSNEEWNFEFKWEDVIYRMHIKTELGKKSCVLQIIKEDITHMFDVYDMELIKDIDEHNNIKYADTLIMKVKDMKSGTNGEFFMTVYELEKKIWKMNKIVSRKC